MLFQLLFLFLLLSRDELSTAGSVINLLFSNGLAQALSFSPLFPLNDSLFGNILQCWSGGAPVFGLQVKVSFNVFDRLAISGSFWLILGTENM